MCRATDQIGSLLGFGGFTQVLQENAFTHTIISVLGEVPAAGRHLT